MEENGIVTPEVDPSEIRAIRVEKLKNLQAAGKDPFALVKFDKRNTSR